MLPFSEANDLNSLRMLRELLYPAHKESENRVLRINRLRNDEESHRSLARSSLIRVGISPTAARCARAVSSAWRGSSCRTELSSMNPTMASESAVGSATGTDNT